MYIYIYFLFSFSSFFLMSTPASAYSHVPLFEIFDHFLLPGILDGFVVLRRRPVHVLHGLALVGRSAGRGGEVVALRGLVHFVAPRPRGGGQRPAADPVHHQRHDDHDDEDAGYDPDDHRRVVGRGRGLDLRGWLVALASRNRHIGDRNNDDRRRRLRGRPVGGAWRLLGDGVVGWRWRPGLDHDHVVGGRGRLPPHADQLRRGLEGRRGRDDHPGHDVDLVRRRGEEPRGRDEGLGRVPVVALAGGHESGGGRGVLVGGEADLAQPRAPLDAVLLVVARRVLEPPRVSGRRRGSPVDVGTAPSSASGYAGRGPRVWPRCRRNVDRSDEVVTWKK